MSEDTPAQLHIVAIIAACLAARCAGHAPTAPQAFDRFDEFEKSVRVETPKSVKSAPNPAMPTRPLQGTSSRASKNKSARPLKRLPANVTETNRRPAVEPCPVGETIVLTMKYTGTSAGELVLETKPFVMVNNRKAYYFSARLFTNKFFSLFFRINDSLELYYDYETLVPLSLVAHTEEGRRRQERRTYYDWTGLRASEWERTLEGSDPVTTRTKVWAVEPLAQSLFSSIYFLRMLPLEPGRRIVFPITHDERNFHFEADVVAREVVSTAAGDINTVLVRASDSFTSVFNKTKGETRLWISDDDRKIIVRLESPLRFGKLTGVLKSYRGGVP